MLCIAAYRTLADFGCCPSYKKMHFCPNLWGIVAIVNKVYMNF